MKILSLNAKDMGGGAANAGYRLNQGLNNVGVSSKLFVRQKNKESEDVVAPNRFYSKHDFRNHLDMLPIKHRKEKGTPFSLNWVPDKIPKIIDSYNPDILHLHWVAGGFMRIERLKQVDQPVVWTLHDMWPFTGGCHYSQSCDRFQYICGKCPILNSKKPNDITKRRQVLKGTILDKTKIRFIAPCEWMAKKARSSRIIDDSIVDVIPNGINTELYKPQPDIMGYRQLELDENKDYVLFVDEISEDSRKGGQFVRSLEKHLSRPYLEDLVLVTLGSNKKYKSTNHLSIKSLGYLNEKKLSVLYSTVDVTIMPSLHDNFPYTTMESMAAGTPCVVFPTGGLPEMVDHKRNGYITDEYSSSALANGIKWILSDRDRLNELGSKAREKVLTEYKIDDIADEHRSLYSSIL